MTSLNKGHGRLERRELTTSTVLEDYLDWPGAHQVFRLERRTTLLPSGEVRGQVVYGVTSLGPNRADPERLLRIARGHWHIENRSHWVREVTFDEDRSQVRVGSIPEVMAAFRNAVIGLLRATGHDRIASTCRRLAAHPWEALALLGISEEN
ncbi:MAG: ISAs1 family transposase [Chloroflexi bacterium]|nr:ISAs1 family transposase [Chloroflexota bacterium]